MKFIFLFISLVLTIETQAKIYTYEEFRTEIKYDGVPTYEEEKAVGVYINTSDSFYAEINNYLRYYPKKYKWYSTSPKDAKAYAKIISSFIERHPALPKDIVLFRGLNLSWRNNKPFTVGEKFSDKAFTSTSLKLEMAEQFASDEDEEVKTEKALFVMYAASESQKGVLITEIEQEVLLPTCLNFKVMDVKQKQKYKMYLIQICKNPRCGVGPSDSVLTDWNGL